MLLQLIQPGYTKTQRLKTFRWNYRCSADSRCITRGLKPHPLWHQSDKSPDYMTRSENPENNDTEATVFDIRSVWSNFESQSKVSDH